MQLDLSPLQAVGLHHFLHQREIVLVFLQDAIQQSATLLRIELLILFEGAQQVPKGDEGGFSGRERGVAVKASRRI
jgi:hypothetical protein